MCIMDNFLDVHLFRNYDKTPDNELFKVNTQA